MDHQPDDLVGRDSGSFLVAQSSSIMHIDYCQQPSLLDKFMCTVTLLIDNMNHTPPGTILLLWFSQRSYKCYHVKIRHVVQHSQNAVFHCNLQEILFAVID